MPSLFRHIIYMNKTIILNGQKIEYELTRKSVKNINLRIRSDGVHVSCSRLVPVSTVESFMRSNADFILKALNKLESRESINASRLDYRDGDLVAYMGEKLPLKVVAGTRAGVDFGGRGIKLTVKDPNNTENRRKVMEGWLREQCMGLVGACCEAVYPHFKARGVPRPTVKYRRMSSRWGSCAPTKAQITFNTALISVPYECMEYVVVHEFAHFLQPNHSAAFYAEVEKLLPDWKRRRAGLGEYEL